MKKPNIRSSILHKVYLLTYYWVYVQAYVYFLFSQKIENQHGIIAFPYYPQDWPGSVERIANWKPFFEAEGLNYHVEWSCTKKEFLQFLESGDHFRNFLFHIRILLRRSRQFKKIASFETVYIQREFIPLFDHRRTEIEKLLNKVHKRVIYDYYDADYMSTPKVTLTNMKYGFGITVASHFLHTYAQKLNANVLYSRLCLPDNIDRIEISENKDIIIGWMGSPSNAENLIKLSRELDKINSLHSNVKFSIACRKAPALNFNFDFYDINSPTFNYEDWLKTIDIGLVPYLDQSDRTKAKTAMKSLEFWRQGISVICSPLGMSDQIEHRVNCMIANSISEWNNCLNNLIQDRRLRKAIGIEGQKTFKKFHTYSQNYEELAKFLLPKDQGE